MKSLNAEDPILKIFVLAKSQKEFSIYFGPIEEFILDHFKSFNPFSSKYYEYIQRYKKNLSDVKKVYSTLTAREDFSEFEMKYLFLPSIFIDFDKQIYYSRYYEQAIEQRMVETWSGRYEPFFNLIPEEYHYWIVKNIDYSRMDG